MRFVISFFTMVFVSANAFAGEAAFHPGPAIEAYGMMADIRQDMTIPDNARFVVRFDIKDHAAPGAVSRRLETAARFINMHAAIGVSPENIKLAIVVHGGAVKDVAETAFYKSATGAENANLPLIAALMDYDVRIIVCGQSAAYYEVENDDLAPGVEMALSAMTAHALLDAEGYVLNPF